jgi:hypothetical protein
MKTKIISKILLTLGLVLVLGSAVTPMNGGTEPSSASVTGPPVPVVTIHTVTASGFTASSEDVTRGQTGTFVLSSLAPQTQLGTIFVNFSVGGTAIPGVDYTALVSPAFIKQSGLGVILVQTLPDPRASFVAQAQSVVVTLEPGPGYAVGQPSSAKILIQP